VVAVICGDSPSTSVMDHISRQTGQRFLAGASDQQKLIPATQDLRECESCRGNVITRRQSRPDSLLELFLPETPMQGHPSGELLLAFVDGDLMPPDRPFLKSHVRKCALCHEIVADLKSFRIELIQMPERRYAPEPKALIRRPALITRHPQVRRLRAGRNPGSFSDRLHLERCRGYLKPYLQNYRHPSLHSYHPAKRSYGYRGRLR
jgi:hypothetical protein